MRRWKDEEVEGWKDEVEKVIFMFHHNNQSLEWMLYGKGRVPLKRNFGSNWNVRDESEREIHGDEHGMLV